uniref:Uncharacterized protein n=1 Tax=Rhizophora mucronata TaxID=61149 RepID=A0A2P2IYH7_RHIMU
MGLKSRSNTAKHAWYIACEDALITQYATIVFEHFDRHCPWVGQCIGKVHPGLSFLVFLLKLDNRHDYYYFKKLVASPTCTYI